MPWHTVMEVEKTFTGEMKYSHTDYSNINVQTSRDKVEELWSMLRYDILIDGSVDDEWKSMGANKAKRSLLKVELQSYIDQAENFYKYARLSDYRSAALLFYYSYLNLAKAAIVINKPNLSGKTFKHGINRKVKTGSLQSRSLNIQESSGNKVAVFNELYEIINGNNLPGNRSISIENILGYISDISVETQKLSNKFSRKIHDVNAHVLINNDTRKCWTVLVSEFGFYPANFKRTFKPFTDSFTRFKPGLLSLEFTYKMTSMQAGQLNFSHSNDEFDLQSNGGIPMFQFKRLLDQSFGKHYQPNLVNGNVSFSVTDPLRSNWQIPFNEPLAIYFLMFYLSEIVRYNPSEFEKAMSPKTKEGWLVRSFIESAPYTGLLHLASITAKKNYVITSR